MANSALVKVVAGQLSDITEEQVKMVLAAVEAVQSGEPVGTVRVNPDSGAVAVRVSDDGVLYWKVSALDGGTWNDMQPSFPGWEKLR
jgi:hypothetical protein